MLHLLLTILTGLLGPTTPAAPGPSHLGGPAFHPSPSHAPTLPSPAPQTRWVLSQDGTEARYRVREQLAGFDFPNDAVGRTSEVSGYLMLGDEGEVVEDQSEFRVQLGALATDNARRDGYVHGRTLQTEEYPEAVLVPLRFLDLPFPLPESGSASFSLEADLTLHGHTRPTMWEVSAEFGPGTVTGTATTSFQFDTFEIPIPQVARVLSVEDNIRLELDFRLVREGN